jgi:hypothetical protein
MNRRSRVSSQQTSDLHRGAIRSEQSRDKKESLPEGLLSNVANERGRKHEPSLQVSHERLKGTDAQAGRSMKREGGRNNGGNAARGNSTLRPVARRNSSPCRRLARYAVSATKRADREL